MKRNEIGAWATIIYVLVLAAATENRWGQFESMGLNELGDFLAGAFGPIATFWLILGFFQQGEELRLQVKELNNSVKQYERLADIAQREHEATIAAYKEQRVREKRQRQPRLFFQFVRKESLNGHPLLVYHLKNGGRECSQVQVTLNELSGVTLRSEARVQHLATGDHVELRFERRGTSLGPFVDIVSVSYRDAHGERAAARFRFQGTQLEPLLPRSEAIEDEGGSD